MRYDVALNLTCCVLEEQGLTKGGLVVAILVCVLALGSFAFADDIIYNNGGPNQNGGNEMTVWVQSEEFTLSSSANVTGIHFWDIEDSPGYAGSITWWITGDTNGVPDFNNVLGTGIVQPTRTATGKCVINDCEYQNDWTVASILLQAGVTYHLALHNGPIGHDSRDNFYWETTDDVDSQWGFECNLPDNTCFTGWYNNGMDHAFYLTGGLGNEIPEPGTLVMLGTGLLGGVAMLRRRLL